MSECYRCGFWNSDYEACECSFSDKWYACPIESKKPENIQALKEYAEMDRCADCKHLGTLYIPPGVKGVNLPTDAQEYLPMCKLFCNEHDKWECMLLDGTDGGCEMFTRKATE